MRSAPWRTPPRIDELFGEHFFATNFWQMWRTTFAFQNWHSAAEMRRYFKRFIQEFDRIHLLSGVSRTTYNQYDSMVVPTSTSPRLWNHAGRPGFTSRTPRGHPLSTSTTTPSSQSVRSLTRRCPRRRAKRF
ncbi:hypothetical protein E3O46_06060 [Cryobacterium glucosi]|uniref:Uncharacterized protein n=2 Tax=Cryobacterium glucosi TaxID=1259175 RepID=A0ABY2IPC4_9MICO|nr:hypothetical protein E3O46_06060 [Cryobacterium glucosi]